MELIISSLCVRTIAHIKDYTFNCFTEIAGNIFFGSSLGLLHRIIDELGINMQDESFREKSAFRSPHVSPFQVLKDKRPSGGNDTSNNLGRPRSPPQYLAIDLSKLHNLDGR
jgi:hypothetical protein